MRLEATFKLRRDTSANWNSKDTILDEGEPGYETDTGLLKIGDGLSPWTLLEAFHPGTPNPGTGASDEALIAHINSLTPHPVYDDGPSLFLLYQNAKV